MSDEPFRIVPRDFTTENMTVRARFAMPAHTAQMCVGSLGGYGTAGFPKREEPAAPPPPAAAPPSYACPECGALEGVWHSRICLTGANETVVRRPCP